MSEHLIQRWLQHGDEEAAEALYQAYHTRVYRLAYALLGNADEAEEVMQDVMVYALNRSGSIANVITGNKCASGTGEFFLQQLRRMDVTLEEAAQWAAIEEPHHVSGRRSVFCKSDCTHATNKGIPKSQVTAGLCNMMANKILELLKKVERRNIMVVGGTARNRMMIDGPTEEVMALEPLADKLSAFGMAVENIDGHDFDALAAAVDAAKSCTTGPTAILANTVMNFDEAVIKR